MALLSVSELQVGADFREGTMRSLSVPLREGRHSVARRGQWLFTGRGFAREKEGIELFRGSHITYSIKIIVG